MTGQFHLVLPEAVQDKHVHLVLDLDDGQQLRFRDTRKFGRFYLVDHPKTVVVSSQHAPDVDHKKLTEAIIEEVVRKEIPCLLYTSRCV